MRRRQPQGQHGLDLGSELHLQLVEPDASQVKDIATLLFNEYLLPFEVTSALLLAAIVGAVVISRRGRAAS